MPLKFRHNAQGNIIFTKMDFPRIHRQSPAGRAHDAELAKRYGFKGFSTILVLNAKGPGGRSTGKYARRPKPFAEAL